MEKPYNLVLEAFSSKKRNSIIYLVETSVSTTGAWISEFNDMSANLLNFVIECEPARATELINCLVSEGLGFFADPHYLAGELKKRKTIDDWVISLNVKYSGGEKGDLGTRSQYI